MRKILAVIAAVSTIYSGSAQAGQSHVNGYGYGNSHYRPHHHHHRHGNNNNWVVPLIGGLIIGGAIANGNGYYQERPVRCYREYSGEYWNGWEWVQTYRKVCY